MKSGFTIVELLIVVVVIAILAAITIVSYNGITNSANDSTVKSDLSTMAKKIEMAKVTTTENVCYTDGTAACLNASPELKSITSGSYGTSNADAIRYSLDSPTLEINAVSKSGKIFEFRRGSVTEVADRYVGNNCTWGQWSSVTKLWTVISQPC